VKNGEIARRAAVGRELKGYVDGPYAEQVFKLEREFKQMNTGQIMHEVVYGITSLTAKEARAQRVLEITRSHWGIEVRVACPIAVM
jgi:hypothetical protein